MAHYQGVSAQGSASCVLHLWSFCAVPRATLVGFRMCGHSLVAKVNFIDRELIPAEDRRKLPQVQCRLPPCLFAVSEEFVHSTDVQRVDL